MSDKLLEIRKLRVSVFGDEGEAQILDFIDLDLEAGEILGVVGESGCGKSTLVKAILGLLPRGAKILDGAIRYRGDDLTQLSAHEVARRIRGRAMGFVPQDPYLSLNPVFKVGRQMLELLYWREGATNMAEARRRLIAALREVQLPDAEAALERYPHQFSGGQRQRILIAAALAARPEIILADEPTTALDVTTQMEILRLLRRLANEHKVSILLVTHDFGAVAQLCDRVSVLYAGQTVETGLAGDVIAAPSHPYTRALLDCHPDRDGALEGIPGQVASAYAQPPGCRFHPRCDLAVERCKAAIPDYRRLGRRQVACIFAGEQH